MPNSNSNNTPRARLLARAEAAGVAARAAEAAAAADEAEVINLEAANAMGECVLPPDAAVADDNRNPRRRRQAPASGEGESYGLLVQTTANHALERLVLPDALRVEIKTALRAIEIRRQMDEVWNLTSIDAPVRTALNFYGPPGTGKTRAALAVAHSLGRPLLQVDYSALISKYLGDTAKHLVAVFKAAREAGAVLFFDEADSMLSRRVSMDQSCATSINQNRNVLMQELDRFAGVVIFTTNLFTNYDEALLRRIGRHLKFELPNREQRGSIFRLHLPNADRVAADLNAAADFSAGLSGGDIRNVCLHAMMAASLAEENADLWCVTTDLLRAEVEKVKAAKAAHSGRPAALSVSAN